MWPDQTRSLELISTLSVKRLVGALTIFYTISAQSTWSWKQSIFFNFFYFKYFFSFSALLGWHVGCTWEQVYRLGQRLWKSLQDCHQKGWAGAWVLQVKRKINPGKGYQDSYWFTSVSQYLHCVLFICSPQSIDFWTKFTLCSRRPAVRLALFSSLKRDTSMWLSALVEALVSKNIWPYL